MTPSPQPPAENVVQGDFGTSDIPLRRRRMPFCAHRKVELMTNTRKVLCRDCGEEILAFDHLLEMAKRWEQLEGTRLVLKNEIAALEKRAKELRKTWGRA